MGTSARHLIASDADSALSKSYNFAGELQEFLYENVEKGAWARVS